MDTINRMEFKKLVKIKEDLEEWISPKPNSSNISIDTHYTELETKIKVFLNYYNKLNKIMNFDKNETEV